MRWGFNLRSFVKGRDYDPDRERSERRKLKKLIKQEAKGAVRELRKDNYFLLEVKEREKLELKQEKAEQYGRAKAFLQEQEHAFKSGQLGKSRKRRKWVTSVNQTRYLFNNLLLASLD